MTELLLQGLAVYILVFSILIVLKNIGSFIRVIITENGKLDLSRFELGILGGAISYIITYIVL